MRLRLILAIVLLTTTAFAQSTPTPSTTPADPAPSTSTTPQQDLPSAPSASPKVFPGGTPPAQQPAPTTAPAPAAQQPAQTTSQPAQPPAQSKSLPDVSVPPQQPTAAKPSTPDTQKGQELQTNDQGEYSLIRTINEVNTVFTVTDKHGHFVKDLKEADFRIVDDGKPPKVIDFFGNETNLPLRVGLLIDASNSIRDRFRFEQESAIEFLNQIVRRNSDEAFVIGFDSTPELKQDFTDNTNKLAAGVRDLRPGGGTALYDAIYFACRDKLQDAHSKKGPVRKAIILLTDGEDNQSRVLREEAIEMAERAEVIIYAISTNISGIKTRGDKVLERFAEMTGGRVFFPLKLEQVTDAFTGIQEELRSQYAVAYKPMDFATDGRFRAVSIEPAKNKGLRVRSRRGYYAPKK